MIRYVSVDYLPIWTAMVGFIVEMLMTAGFVSAWLH
jgi:hypothetical protein